MIVGTTIFKFDGNSYFSPEFPRGGLGVNMIIDVTQIQGAPTVTAKLQDRNSEDTSFADLATFSSITAVGISSVDATGIKEILRVKIDFDAGDDATDALHFLIQPPTWRPY